MDALLEKIKEVQNDRQKLIEVIASFLEHPSKKYTHEEIVLDIVRKYFILFPQLYNPLLHKDNKVAIYELLKESKKSYYYFQALCQIAARWAVSAKTTPLCLRKWTSAFLRAEVNSPRKPGGSPKNIRFNLYIHHTIENLTEAGYQLSRNETTETSDTAFDIVAQAATISQKKKMTYEAIRTIYFRQCKKYQT